MNERVDQYRQRVDQLYKWFQEDEHAIDDATTALLYDASNCESRRKALRNLARATERATWCNDRIAEMTTTTKAGAPCE